MHTRVRPGSSDSGETLVELIIAVAIMGVTVVAIVGGIGTSILMSDTHRKQTTAGVSVRNYAAAVIGHYDATASPNYLPDAVGFTPPDGYEAAPTSVKCWHDSNGTSPDPPAFSDCTEADADTVQQVTLSVMSTDSRAKESLAVVVWNP